MPKISVIVPVYKAEEYLHECIDSILKQTFCDFELILVDDGSPDSSGAICDEYAQKDNRIHVIHQSNGGVTSARAAGVKASKAEWITFVDADDSLPGNALAALASKLDEGTDIVIGNIDERKYPDSIELDEYRSACISGRIFHSGPYARVFSASLFNDHTFDIPRRIKRGEDLIMNVRLAFATNKPPRIINKKVYDYRVNESSVMHITKHDLEHATLFHHYLEESIPNNEHYEKDIIHNKIISIFNVIYDNPTDRTWRESVFWNNLKHDILKTGYKLSLKERLMLMPWNKLSLRISIKLQQIFG